MLQEKYGIPGKLTFDGRFLKMWRSRSNPTNGRSHAEPMRSSAVPRLSPDGRRYGAQFMADMLDPVNIAATMVPVAPEIDLG